MCSNPVRHIHRMHPIDADQDHALCRMVGWRVDQRLWVLLLSSTRTLLLRREGFAQKSTHRTKLLSTRRNKVLLNVPVAYFSFSVSRASNAAGSGVKISSCTMAC